MSFDAPLDSAVEVNLLGPSRVATAMNDLVVSHRPPGAPLPHLISVSTAYVSSGHRGDAPEEPISQSPFIALPDWRAEVEAARRARADAHAESRMPDQLAKFRKAARGELGAAGTALLAEKTEKLREDWVRTASSSSVRPEPRRSAGRTPTHTPSPSARWRSPTPRATCR